MRTVFSQKKRENNVYQMKQMEGNDQPGDRNIKELVPVGILSWFVSLRIKREFSSYLGIVLWNRRNMSCVVSILYTAPIELIKKCARSLRVFFLKGRCKLLNVASFCVLSWFCLLQIVSSPKPYQTCSSYRFFVGNTLWERTLAHDGGMTDNLEKTTKLHIRRRYVRNISKVPQ